MLMSHFCSFFFKHVSLSMKLSYLAVCVVSPALLLHVSLSRVRSATCVVNRGHMNQCVFLALQGSS